MAVKWGKSESGAVWLSADKTSPYQFYQYWLKSADADLETLIKYFSLKSRAEMEEMISRIPTDPRAVKQEFAQELTARLHGQESVEQVEQVSTLIFSKTLSAENIAEISAGAFEMMAQDIPGFTFDKKGHGDTISLEEMLTETCPVFSSKSEFRRAVKGNALSVNKSKVADPTMELTAENLIHEQYIMVENGKKNKFLLRGY